MEPIDHCYHTILESSRNAILLLSPESIILGWNRAAETFFGWIADEALGRSYAELCLPLKKHKSFLDKLARATEGSEVRELELPLRTRTGSEMLFSWNISRILGTHGHLIGLMTIGTGVFTNTDVEEELRLAHAQVLSETRRGQRAVEEERRRIARELHDDFGQVLTGLKFDLAWCGMKLAQSPAPADSGELLNKIQAMSGSIASLLESVRSTASALRPAMLDDLGLIPALECLATTFRDRTGAQCVVDVAQELSSIVLSSDTSAALFRIAQELLTNVMRHAAASQVHMRLYLDGAMVTLAVTDNGKGFTRERMTRSRSFGIRGMQERVVLLGGHFDIVGTTGVGTRASASVPVAECLTS